MNILTCIACYKAIICVIINVLDKVFIVYSKQPEISQEYVDSFRSDDYYSDEVSCDRAAIIEDTMKALIERLRMIERAEERIVLSTFEFRSDESGKDILAALLMASERGVDIKILIDGTSSLVNMNNNEYFKALSTTDNIEIKIYNTINLLKPWKSMGRLHDKYIIVDDDLYLLGGRNTYNYFLGDNGYKNYDRDLLVYNTEPQNTESSIYSLIEYFEHVWNLKECSYYNNNETKLGKKKVTTARQELRDRYQKNIDKLPYLLEEFDYIDFTYEVNKISLLVNPVHIYSKEPTVFYSLIQLMKDFKNEVNIHTPYIICNDIMYEALESVCSGNGNVKLMTNSVANNGNPFGASDYLINRDKLLQTGLNIYEYEGGISYHGKSITIDNNISIIGSFNMDIRSAYLDTEVMLVVDSEEINRQLSNYMESYEADAIYVMSEENVIVPEGVIKQELTPKRNARIKTVSLFNWLRFLM